MSAAALPGAGASAVKDGIFIRWIEPQANTRKWAVEVENLGSATLQALRSAPLDPAQWAQIFAVHVDRGGSGAGDGLPPIQGRYELLEDRIRFEPQYPAQPGLTYRAQVQTSKLPKFGSPELPPVVARFSMPAPVKVPKTLVQHVYPTTSRLPENLLKFYIHFTGPMSRGNIYQHIHLLDASGQTVALPFLEIDEELWDPELTRLTLFIDPGRIKRGVRPLEEIGPSMEAGKRYTLVIDQNWQDGEGIPLKKTFRKTFAVGPPDREPLDPKGWNVRSPKAGTRDPLVIRFPEPLDHALAQRLIWVVDPGRRILAGQTELSDQERQWSFTPEASWTAGRHEIVASHLVEDLAGNSIGKPFEVDVFERVHEKPMQETVALPFEVRGR